MSNEHIKKARTLQIINLIGFVLTVSINVMANVIPINGKTTGEISDSFPNLFVPTGLTFAIWGVIYVALAFFVAYQLGFVHIGNKRHIKVVLNIGWLFSITSLANVLWILAWHYEQILLSVLMILVLLISLIMIYKRITQNGLITGKEKLYVKVPFSIYLGWVTVAVIANITAFLVYIDWNGFGISEQIWTIVLIITAAAITCKYLFIQKDILYALVIEWSLLGILIKHLTFFNGVYTGIIMTTVISMLFLLIGIIVIYNNRITRSAIRS